MRKKAQEKKRTMSPASSSISNSSNSSSSSNCSSNPHVDSMPMSETKERSFYDTGGLEMQVMTTARSGKNSAKTSSTTVNSQEEISMDEFWKGIGLLEEEGETITPVYDPYSDLSSPIWDYNPDSLWMMMMSTDNQEERNTTKMFNYPMSEQFGAPLTGRF